MLSRKILLDNIKQETLDEVSIKSTDLFFNSDNANLVYGNIDLTNSIVHTTFNDISSVNAKTLYDLFKVEDSSFFYIFNSDATLDVSEMTFPLASGTKLIIRVTTNDLKNTKDYEYFIEW